ncbi:MAG: hypothetical protein COA78_28365 [Blastopirellula sp.]|nr:MAG: hypothetical protein COA78_28365 [Blastopirellula sp.]
MQRELGTRLASNLPRVIWISAPGGSGKTVFARQIIEETTATSVWLQIEGAHADTGLFLNLLYREISLILDSADLPMPTPDETMNALSYCRRLLFAAAQSTAEPLVIVADDFHLVQPHSETAFVLGQALLNTPPNLHLIVTSRMPRFGSFARVKSEGYVRDVSFEDLRLTASETRELTECLLPIGSDIEEISSEILKITGGWVLASRLLMELYTSNRKGVQAFQPADREALFQLLAYEVFLDLSAEELRVLGRAACLPGLPAQLLAPVLDIEGAAAVMERLADQSMLVTRRPNGQYRVHDLVCETLSVDRRVMEDVTPKFLENAASHFLANGYLQDGRSLLAQSQNWQLLANEIEKRALELVSTGRFAFLGDLLTGMPEDQVMASSQLRFWRGICLQGNDASRAGAELRSLYFDTKDTAPVSEVVRVWGAAIDATWAEWPVCQIFDPLIADIEKLHTEIKEHGDETDMNALARGAFAALALRNTQKEGFADWETRSLELFLTEPSRTESVKRGLQLMIHYTWGTGEHAKATLVRQRLRNWLDDEFCPPGDNCVQYTVEGAYQTWFGEGLDAAVANGRAGIAMSASLGAQFWDVPILNAALYKILSMEAIDIGWEFAGVIAERNHKDSRINDLAIQNHVESYLHWLEGDLEMAVLSSRTAYALALQSGFCLSPIYYGIGLSAVLNSSGDRHEARKYQSAARHAAVVGNSPCMTFMALMLGAASALTAAHPGRVLAYLRPALKIAGEQKYTSVPWVRRADTAILLQLARERGIELGAVDLLYTALQLSKISTDRHELVDKSSLRAAHSKTIQVRTLGSLEVVVDGESKLASAKTQHGPLELLLHLVAAGSNGVRREALINLLWPDAEYNAGRDRLKTTVYRLRQMLDNKDTILTKSGQVLLNADLVFVDAWALEDAADRTPDSLVGALGNIAFYRGPFYEAFDRELEFLLYRGHCSNAVVGLISGALSLPSTPHDTAALPFLENIISKLDPGDEMIESIRQGFNKRGWSSALDRLETLWAASA